MAQFVAKIEAALLHPGSSAKRKAYRTKAMESAVGRALQAPSRWMVNVRAGLKHPLSREARQAYRSEMRRAYERSAEPGAMPARTIPDDVNPSVPVPFRTGLNLDEFGSVAVIVHIFYPDLLESLLGYLRNIPVGFSLFISTDTEAKRQQILAGIPSDLVADEIELRLVPNVGRDIAPKLIAFRDVYDRFDFFLHLHTKKSPHGGEKARGWRDYLMHSLIGTPDIAASNLELLSAEDVGIVYPEHDAFIRPWIHWGSNFEIARELLARSGIIVTADHILEFPSGSMYWGRSAALRKLLDLDLEWSDFPVESDQTDCTLAHAIERSILYFAEGAGFRWTRVRVQTSKGERPTMAQPFRAISTLDALTFPPAGS